MGVLLPVRYLEGVGLITEKVSDEQLQETLKHIDNHEKISNLTDNENRLVLKTLLYLVQRFKMFVMSPVKLQSDLMNLGFSSRKSEILTETYSESNRDIIRNLKSSEDNCNDPKIAWDIKTIIKDEVTDKCKKPVARLCLKQSDQELIQDLSHSEMLVLFDNFEKIQLELDMLSSKK